MLLPFLLLSASLTCLLAAIKVALTYLRVRKHLRPHRSTRDFTLTRL